MKKKTLLILAALLIGGIFIFSRAMSDADESRASRSLPAGDNAPLLEVKIPESLPSVIKDYTGFSLSFNSQNHTPNYVAWELLDSETDGEATRSNKFWQDTSLKGCPDTNDYTHSGYDRGHLCPAADQKWSPQAMQDCFVLANICPQDHSLNSGAWNTLEQKCRKWAKRDKALIIVAGPVYLPSDTKTIGKAAVRVPSAFFKVILRPDSKAPRAIGFIYPNMSSPGNMRGYAMSVDDVEKTTGFDFFSALPDNVENRIEAECDFATWDNNR